MPTCSDVLAQLRSKAADKTRQTYIRHGAQPDRTLGVSVADMKLIAKGLKKQQALACELYETAFFEAMYLAGIVADGAQLSSSQLQAWAEAADHMPMVSEYTVPWLAIESRDARKLALRWIKSKKEHVAAAGWRTYTGLVMTRPDEELDLAEIRSLLQSIPARMAVAANRVRYTMNGFVISVGSYVEPLLDDARPIAEELGDVSVDVGDTACQVPVAAAYIAKMRAKGRAAAKRKTMRC